MSLQHAILAALGDGESSGYDLAKQFDVSVANFWSATPQQIYRELDRMESDGLLAARILQQERRPNKRLFSITERGRAEVLDFVRGTPKPMAMRDELLVQIDVVDRAEITPVREHVATHLEASRAKLEGYLRSQQKALAGRTEVEFFESARRIGPYLALKRGIVFEEGNVAWCEETLRALDLRSVRDLHSVS